MMTKTMTTKIDLATARPSIPSSAKDYLSLPYARKLTPDPDGGFTATIQEFPGCIAEGDTADEALRNLESTAISWIEAQQDLGQEIPLPIDNFGYSGKIALRIPRGIHKQVAELALSEQTSVNQLLLAAIASYVGAKGVAGKVADDFSRLMAKKVENYLVDGLQLLQLQMFQHTRIATNNSHRLIADVPNITLISYNTKRTEAKVIHGPT